MMPRDSAEAGIYGRFASRAGGHDDLKMLSPRCQAYVDDIGDIFSFTTNGVIENALKINRSYQ